MLVSDLQVDRGRLAECCRRYGVARLEVFGSFARGDADDDSDLDLLVTFLPGIQLGIEYIAFCLEIESIVGRKVDLLTRRVVEESDNPWFKAETTNFTEELYRAPAG